jgi:transcription termination/antitermination protein NusG
MEGFCQDCHKPEEYLAPGPPVAERAAWYVIHARSRHEAKVALALQQKEFEIFLPRITVRSRRQDRRQFLKVPLFPSYLFVNTVLEPVIYHEIIKLPGVVRLLGVNGRPSPVSTEKVESIKAIVESDRPYYPWVYLGEGKQVRILDGPLAGTIGLILRRREKKRRLLVAVELFQRSVAVELEDEAVEAYS